jgi:small subunit ribosomal protein S17
MKTESNKTSEKNSKRRVMVGEVVRRSGDKTVAVEVSRVTVHPVYHKRRTEKKVYLAHDEKNLCNVGDHVSIKEARPLSARKRWVVFNNGEKK